MRDWSYASPSQLEGMVDRETYSSRHVAIVISCNTNGYCGAAYDVGTQESPSLKRLLRLNPQVWLNRVHNKSSTRTSCRTVCSTVANCYNAAYQNCYCNSSTILSYVNLR